MTKKSQIKYIEFDTHVEGVMPNCSVFYIDKDDFENIKEYCWFLKSGYPFNITLGLLHRFIMKDMLSNDLEIDHINRNRLDCRKDNLRLVTRSDNMKNKSKYKTNTSGYAGVKWNTKLSKWQVQITIDKIRKHLGVFDNLQDAIIARRTAEKQLCN